MKKRIRLTTKSAWAGVFFAMPFYLGFLFFFLIPCIQSLAFAFSDVVVDIGAYRMDFTGLSNIHYIFAVDTYYATNLVSSFLEVLWKTPIILLTSLFFAVILNQKFRGRLFVRAVFFLPVIISSGMVMNVLNNDVVVQSALSGSVVAGGTITQSTALSDLLIESGLNGDIVDYITTVSDSLFSLVWKTGIQMIIFLAGLQSISPSLYEASSMEGATAWENFWKITMPMLKPMILVNLVYTIVDSFTDANNSVMLQVMNNNYLMRLGQASAMAWIYFLMIGVLLLFIMLVFRKSFNEKQ